MKLFQFALVAAVLILVAPLGHATCPTAPSGPYYVFPLSWWNYTPDVSCVVANGSASSTTACGVPGWSIGTTTASMRYTFVVNQTGISFWSAGADIEFTDPTNSASNYVDIYAMVTHNGVDTETLLYTVDGTGSDLNCAHQFGYFYDAVYGDTVQIAIISRKPSATASIKIASPTIYGYY